MSCLLLMTGSFLSISIVGLGPENHDEAQFADPERLDITHVDNPHLAFGYGPHACIAAVLNRMYLRTAINTLLQRVDNLQLENAEIVWIGAPIFRLTESLPVTFTPRV